MNIVPIHFNKSLPVSNWQAIVDVATEMANAVDTKEMYYEDGKKYTGIAVALHHSQVSNTPFNFFVVNSLLGDIILKELGSRFIVNPKIEMLLTESVRTKKKKMLRGLMCAVSHIKFLMLVLKEVCDLYKNRSQI
jgi:hypothetical protein